MNILKELLPVSAILFVILLMVYTNLIIIGDIGRLLSIVPISLVFIIWGLAIVKLKRNEHVH